MTSYIEVRCSCRQIFGVSWRMHTNLCATSGVAYTTNYLLFTLRVLSLVVVCLLLTPTYGAPFSATDYKGIDPQKNTNHERKNFFLRTQSGKVLEILNDGTVRGSNCGKKETITKYCKYSPMVSRTKNLVIEFQGKCTDFYFILICLSLWHKRYEQKHCFIS